MTFDKIVKLWGSLHWQSGTDYNQKINANFWLSRLSFRKKEHWKHAQKTKNLVKQ